jgi:Domain of unknown function (DUF4838)
MIKRIFLSFQFLVCIMHCIAQVEKNNIYYTPVKQAPYVWNGYYYYFEPKILAEDLADLLQQATGKEYTVLPYTKTATKGFFLLLDSTSTLPGNEAALINSDGKNFVKITAKYATGISYGLYTYLEKLGFRFYMPGKIWTIAPALQSIYLGKKQNEVWKPFFKHRMFATSGAFIAVKGLDENGRTLMEWFKWYRRNRMGSEFVNIGGHIGELFNITHQKEIEQDPSILAPTNGKRQYSVEGKIDPTNTKGVDMFVNWIITQYKNDNTSVPSYIPWSKFQSVDPGDGLDYCHTPECDKKYKSISDQVFEIANKAAVKIKSVYPNAGVNTYAYTERTDTPSLKLQPNIHVGIVAGAFHNVATPIGLINRWVKKTNHLSIYDYINIGVWNRDMPFFDLKSYFNYLAYIKSLNLDGFAFESGGSNLASAVPQYFILKYLCDPYSDIEKEFKFFCKNSFGNEEADINKMMHQWYFSKVHLGTGYDFASFHDDELGGFFSVINKAANNKTLNSAQAKRVDELKAYAVYLAKYYELGNDLYTAKEYKTNPHARAEKASEILEFTWKMYDKMIFHNTQLNDVMKLSFATDENLIKKWDYTHSDHFKNITSGADVVINKEFDLAAKKYIPKATPFFEENDALFEKALKYRADSFEIKLIDIDYFYSHRYALNVYTPVATTITIDYNAEESKHINKQTNNNGYTALLSSDYLVYEEQFIKPGSKKGSFTYTLPKKGHYTLYVSQNNGTYTTFKIKPDKSLIYINKKVTPPNAVMLLDYDTQAKKESRYLGFYVPNADSVYYNMFCIDCANYVKLYDATGKPKILNNTLSPYNISTAISKEEKNTFMFMTNDLFTWTPVMKNIPPYYFFLKFPDK